MVPRAVSTCCNRALHTGRGPMLQLIYSISIKPFVVHIKRWNRGIENRQLTNRPMPTPRLNQNRIARLNRLTLAIQFDFAAAFQHIINFRHPLVIVSPCVDADFNPMHRSYLVGIVDKRPSRLAARASDRG